jgi:hypothetical protein
VAAALFRLVSAALEPVTTLRGVRHVGTLRTESAVNDYPALPVHTGENVVVSLLAFDGAAEPAGFADALEQTTALLSVPARRLRLEPTSRSRLR